MVKRFIAAAILSVAPAIATAGPLHDAIKAGDLDTAEAVLAEGADPNELDADGRPAIMIAAINGDADAVRLLASNGADPNQSRENVRGYIELPIHFAVKEGHVEAIRALAKNGADIWLAHYELGAPINIAVNQGRSEVISLLRSLGADQLPLEPMAHLIADADVDFGRRVAAVCSKCHEIEEGVKPEGAGTGRLGPSLINIVGRPKADEPDYPYTEAMRKAGGEWTYEDLSHFVVNPTAFIPGTDMWIGGFPVERPRVALIAYLRSITDNPPPLPE